MALGEVDYGLFGLVGGLSAFMVFLNDLFAGAISRYYAVSVGKSLATGDIEDCRRWFCTALMIHTIGPAILLAIGYPIGIWAVKSMLTIPPDRIEACVWVWRFTCITSFASMVNVPFKAMYIAKQYIAELTIYNVATTILNFMMAFYMSSHPREWLILYAGWSCALALVPHILIGTRAAIVFQECRIRIKYFFEFARMRDLGVYVTYRFVGAFFSMMQSQGNAILINKYMGPSFNATMAIGNTVAGHTVSLSTSMSGAIGPAIFNAYGAKDSKRMLQLVNCASKVGTILYLAFMIPVSLEIDALVNLWLKEPPVQSSLICLFILAAYFTERISDGEVNAIYATANIKRFQMVLALWCFVGVVLGWLFLQLGMGIFGVGLAIIIFKALIMVSRVIFARIEAGISAWRWIKGIFVPIMAVTAFCLIIGVLPQLIMDVSFLRVMVTTLVVQAALWPMTWFCVLNNTEREYIISRIKGLTGRFATKGTD